MTQTICTECGYINEKVNLYCDECGFKLSPTKSDSKVESESKPVQEVVESIIEIKPPIVEEEKKKEVAVTEEIVAEVVELTEESTPEAQPKKPSPMTVLDAEEPEPVPHKKKISPPTVLEAPLVVLLHEETGTKFELPIGEKEIYIGKENEELRVHVDVAELPNSDIVSRVQATILAEKDGFYLEDAGSLNGTHLNDEEIKAGARYRKLLKNGDKISFGKNRKMHLIFTIEG